MLTLLMQLNALTKKNNRVTLVCGLAGFQMTSRQFLGLAIGSSPSVKRAPEQRFNLQRTATE
jgi:hypothetical protein